MKYYFIWNDVDCRTKGIRLQSMPEIIRPEERISHVIVPGRAGELTVTEGDDIYNSYIQTIRCVVNSAANVAEAERWLRGDGYITFSGQPNLTQRARVINAVTFVKHSPNSDWWEADVQFYCDPLKMPLTEEAITVTESGTSIYNPGDVESRPLISIEGTGDITITANGKVIYLYGCQNWWSVDADVQWVRDAQYNPLFGVYTGEFPTFAPGYNVIQYTGNVTSLSIHGRWRYL